MLGTGDNNRPMMESQNLLNHPTLWLFLPAYNEAKSFPRLLPKIAAAMTAMEYPYKVVVVDDGSTDKGAESLSEFTNHIPMTILTHPINRGLGETERDGFEYIAWHGKPEDIAIRLDCDDTHDPEYVLTLLNKLQEGYDVVNTSRYQPGGGQNGVSAYRRFISRTANLFMKIVFAIPGIKDHSCGFRAYRVKVLQDAIRVFGDCFIQLRGLGFTSTLEMMVKLDLLGCRFAEVPFVLHYNQKLSASKMVSSATTLGYITMAIAYHWPFGGWRKQWHGLGKLYRQDREAAIRKFSIVSLNNNYISPNADFSSHQDLINTEGQNIKNPNTSRDL